MKIFFFSDFSVNLSYIYTKEVRLDIRPVEAKTRRKRIRGMFDLIDALIILPFFLSHDDNTFLAKMCLH